MKPRLNPFILAHGSASGPLMRPVLTGLIAGEASGLVVFLLLWQFEILSRICQRFGTFRTFIGYVLFGAVAGMIYGFVYRRAANDRRGGWIFGASTGFIFWMMNPIIWWPWFGQKAIFIGTEAIGFMISHILFGFFLGLIFPWVHYFSRRELTNLSQST